jgi:hypothetical protein
MLRSSGQLACALPSARSTEFPSPNLNQGSSNKLGSEPRWLYVVGGQQESLRPLHAGTQPWYRYRKGVVMRVHLPTQKVDTAFEYVSPAAVCPPEDPAILFKSGTLVGDNFYLCTQTEVLICHLTDFTRRHYISLPQFNDVHHVRPTPNGTLLVANTGLDMVMEVTVDGKVVREWSVLDADPWARFSRSVDYRVVASTKPHRSHPNYIFHIGTDIWVTRFEQRDAVCLTDPGKRIDIGLERVHDGIVHDNRIYFSTVNGEIAVVNQTTLRVEEVWNLNQSTPVGDLLGWCRGLLIENGRLWVGFSRLRPTKFRENISWVASGFKRSLPTRVCCYDLMSRAQLGSIDMETHGLNAIFSVHLG